MAFEGMIELWQNADGVIRSCALVLFVMSVLSWTVMLGRAWQYWAYAREYLGVTSNMPASIKEAQKMEGNAEAQNLALQTAVDEEGLRLSGGLVVLALVGSTALFVGLLGTVWGIYITMVKLSVEARMLTIGDVAGPVGETLIMTALGLTVAIPAVIGYNLLEKTRQRLVARLAIRVNRWMVDCQTARHTQATTEA
ncbi:MAG: MotA/TolQ/ExbB proton channel family protein [Sutterella wadsworthensis]|nr:MotA/TolQ/ExbB proton channel family protein [Sutterella wadsworthensis]